MTVLVWDGKSLAADRMFANHNLGIRAGTKIWRHGDILMGGSGVAKDMSALRDWVMGGMEPEKFPAVSSEITPAFWVINRNGTVACFEDGPRPIILEVKQFAEGSGRDFAYGALAMGADARRAVEIACEHDRGCGGGIDVLTFDD